ncbi:Sas10/Utp3/C1D family [Zea mays]|nr:Sas10/Utp3/C1D family [Zea mays]AQK45473.1 Sas10/Utp3/C1D family [Zea mays]
MPLALVFFALCTSVHGLVRGENMELGRDSDTGGEVKYVVELARAMSMMPGVYRVDLFTRQVSSPDVDWSYDIMRRAKENRGLLLRQAAAAEGGGEEGQGRGGGT